jgi:hypothetical protein
MDNMEDLECYGKLLNNNISVSPTGFGGTEFSEKHAMVPCPTLRLYADSTPSQVYDTTKDLSTLPEDFLESMVARILLPVATW